MKDTSFFGRHRELALLDGWLQDAVQSDVGRLIAVRGRRQVGKSRLIEHFAEVSGVPYGVVSGMLAAPAEIQVRQASSSLRSSVRPLPGVEAMMAVTGGDWFDMFFRLNIVLRGGPAILVLDEFPWAAQTNPGLDSLLQSLWDSEFSKRPLLIFLVGSDDALMNRLFAHDQPLFGRLDSQLVVRPFNPAEVAEALGIKDDPVAAFDSHLVTGGFPELVAQARRFDSVPALVEDGLSRAHSELAAAAQINLAGELADSVSARRVLEAC
jgi:AAA+ ATPase superfamily predicted ATPase